MSDTHEKDQTPTHDRKVGRTLRLTPDINDRLIALCDHLGVTVNAYMSNELGKAIARDELTYNLRKNTNDMAELVKIMMASMGDLQAHLDEPKEK